MLEVTGLPADARLSIARLDSYDGIVAGLGDGVFQRVPSGIDQTAAAGTLVSLGVRVDAYRAAWVPGVGPLESISFTGVRAGANADGFYYDPASETMAVSTGGLGQGDAYRLNAVLPRMVSIPLVADLVPGAGAVPQPTGVPPELEDFLLTAAPATLGLGARLAAALQGLATTGYVSHGISAAEPFSRSGQGADRLAQLFTAVPMLGDSEQYAVAAALMADRLGFTARVVVGFAPGAADSGPTLVRGSDISAWIEVQTGEGGWVGIDPTPEVRPVPDAVPEEAAAANRPPVILPPAAEAAPDTAATVPLANQDDQAIAQPNAFWGERGAHPRHHGHIPGRAGARVRTLHRGGQGQGPPPNPAAGAGRRPRPGPGGVAGVLGCQRRLGSAVGEVRHTPGDGRGDRGSGIARARHGLRPCLLCAHTAQRCRGRSAVARLGCAPP